MGDFDVNDTLPRSVDNWDSGPLGPFFLKTKIKRVTVVMEYLQEQGRVKFSIFLEKSWKGRISRSVKELRSRHIDRIHYWGIAEKISSSSRQRSLVS